MVFVRGKKAFNWLLLHLVEPQKREWLLSRVILIDPHGNAEGVPPAVFEDEIVGDRVAA